MAGTITLDGQPIGDATVTFHPQGDTKGNGGEGKSDSTGRYEVSTPRGEKGLLPGKYKVVISRRLNPDGSAPKPDEPPIESQARETLPPRYSSEQQSQLTLNVSADNKAPADFALRSGKK